MDNIFVAFVHLLVIVCTAQACFLDNYMRIHIINELPSNSTLKIHCKSVGHDLGCSSLNSTQHFSWRLCRTVRLNVYAANCRLIWESSSKELTLKVFGNYGPTYTCKLEYRDCYWRLTAQGINNLHKGDPLMFSWRPLVSGVDSPCPNGASENKMEGEHVSLKGFIFIALCVFAIIIVTIVVLYIFGRVIF